MPADKSAAQARPRSWIAALGPGAIVASLTIGTGELIFSSRAGALFGYRVLGLFLLVLLLKWALVFASARHWVFTEVHPLRRFAALPGPRGWLPCVLLVLAIPAFPVWVSFHAGTLGTLVGATSGTLQSLGGNAPLAWGILILAGTLALSLTGGYGRLEKLQAVIVALLILSVLIALVLLRPDWMRLLGGFTHFGALSLPEWALASPEFAQRPAWVETATYAGVIGGSGYDYLAYVAWLRDKHGAGSDRVVEPRELTRMVAADATVSFVMVLGFSAVFVACGAIVLGPQHQVPAGNDLLTLQAQFVSAVGSWLRPLYFAGAFLALGGTLYGTLEVAPATFRELVGALSSQDRIPTADNLRRTAILVTGIGALVLLTSMLGWRLVTGAKEPFSLVAWITPANLFTGVLACGWISLLNLWMDRRFLPSTSRMPWPLALLNLAGGVSFTAVGLKAAWDHGRWVGPLILLGSVATGLILASLLERTRVSDPMRSAVE